MRHHRIACVAFVATYLDDSGMDEYQNSNKVDSAVDYDYYNGIDDDDDDDDDERWL